MPGVAPEHLGEGPSAGAHDQQVEAGGQVGKVVGGEPAELVPASPGREVLRQPGLVDAVVHRPAGRVQVSGERQGIGADPVLVSRVPVLLHGPVVDVQRPFAFDGDGVVGHGVQQP